MYSDVIGPLALFLRPGHFFCPCILSQVAAMTVQELAGPQCTDIIVCPQIRDPEPNGSPSAASADGSNGMLTIECSLLALQAIEEAGRF